MLASEASYTLISFFYSYVKAQINYRRACQPAVNVADRKLAGWGKSQVERLYYSSKVADGQSS